MRVARIIRVAAQQQLSCSHHLEVLLCCGG